MAGYGHDGAGPVADQDIVGDPDGYSLSIYRICRVPSGKNTALLTASGDSVLLAGFGRALPVFLNLFPVFIGRQGIDQWMLRSEHHVGGAE